VPASTPIARNKTAALARILDCVPKGYYRYTSGSVKAAKAEALAQKLHALYGVGCTPAQRLARKGKGLANSVLVMYWPHDAECVEWMLLAADGDGLENETLHTVAEKPRMRWLGYELVRHAARGRAIWTWRRPKEEMADHYVLLASLASQRHYAALRGMLERLARQPGFHGVREQTRQIYLEARKRGYSDDFPPLFYVQKISHGERLMLS